MRYALVLTEYRTINEAIKAIPSSSHYDELDLTGNRLFEQKINDRLQLIKSIPQNYRTLNLTNTELYMLLMIGELFKAIPSHIHAINLSNNRLKPEMLAALPATIQSVVLQEIKGFSLDVFNATVMQMNPDRIKHVDLRHNDLRTLPIENLNLLFNRYSSLSIANTNLTIAQMSAINAPHLRSLDISSNKLGYDGAIDTANAVETMLTHLPGLTHLTLVDNDLGRFSYERVVRWMQAMSRDMKIVDFTSNDVHKWKAQGLIAVMEAMPESVDTLILDNNQFFNMHHAIEVLKAIPPHITTLSLRRDVVGYHSNEDLSLLAEATPDHVTHVVLENNGVSFQQASLLNRTQLGSRFVFDSWIDVSIKHFFLALMSARGSGRSSREGDKNSALVRLNKDALMGIALLLAPYNTRKTTLYETLECILCWVRQVDSNTGRISNARVTPVVEQPPVAPEGNQQTRLIRPDLVITPFAPAQQAEVEVSNTEATANACMAQPIAAPRMPSYMIISILAHPVTPLAGALLLIAAAGVGMFSMGIATGLAVTGGVALLSYAAANCFFTQRDSVDGTRATNIGLFPLR